MRIAINGIGIAGPALAWWLREYGFEPVLFERAPQLRTGGYVIDFWGTGYDIAGKMGLIPKLQEKGYLMETLYLVREDGTRAAGLDATRIRRQMDGQFVSIRRSDISAILFAACAGIEARFGTAITGLEDQGDSVLATLSDGTTERFDLVIGADGLHSAIRALAFGPEARFERPMGAAVSAFTVKGYRPRDDLTYFICQAKKRAVSRISLRDDETLALFTFRDELAGPILHDEVMMKNQLRKAYAGMGWETPALLDALDETEDFYFDRVSQIHMDSWSKGRIALVGDAAACASLLAGEGTGLAITEAYVLAGELHRANGHHVRAFRNYEKRLQTFIAKKQKAARGFLGFFAPKSGFQIALSRLGMQAASIPLLSNLVLGNALRDELELPDYQSTKG